MANPEPSPGTVRDRPPRWKNSSNSVRGAVTVRVVRMLTTDGPTRLAATAIGVILALLTEPWLWSSAGACGKSVREAGGDPPVKLRAASGTSAAVVASAVPRLSATSAPTLSPTTKRAASVIERRRVPVCALGPSNCAPFGSTGSAVTFLRARAVPECPKVDSIRPRISPRSDRAPRVAPVLEAAPLARRAATRTRRLPVVR